MKIVVTLLLVILVIGSILIYGRGIRSEKKKGYSREEANRRIKKMLK